MMFGKFLALMLGAAAALNASNQDVFDLKAELIRPLRNRPGNLHADPQGVSFRSSDGKTEITIRFEDLRAADVADPRSLHFETYEVRKWKPFERRTYRFRASPDAPVEDLARFLAGRIYRPVVGHYPSGAEFRIAAYHRRLRQGSNGALEIGEQAIQFVSANPADSRTWLYRDIETIGTPDRYRFRVTTSRETYVLELKSELPEAAYRFAWDRVYRP